MIIKPKKYQGIHPIPDIIGMPEKHTFLFHEDGFDLYCFIQDGVEKISCINPDIDDARLSNRGKHETLHLEFIKSGKAYTWNDIVWQQHKKAEAYLTSHPELMNLE